MGAKTVVSTADVARLAGVSTATVSNTINHPERVLESTRRRVREAIDQLDFLPNRAAATLRQGSSKLIGLVVPDIENPFYAAIAHGAGVEATRQGYALALCVTSDDVDQELRHLGHLAELRAAGALVVPLSADEGRLERLRRMGTRLVLIDRVSHRDEGAVAIDDVLGGRIAVEHLLDSGRERLVLVTGPVGIPQCADRREGARAALAARTGTAGGLPEVEVPEMTIEQGVLAGERIAAGPLPDGVFCLNDQLALGVVRGLAASGVRVPEDVAVVGYGDLSIATESQTQLTTVRQPNRELGEAAVRRLLAELAAPDGAAEAPPTVFRPTLVVRDSAP